MAPTAPYERLYNDIEDGLEMGSADDLRASAHDQPTLRDHLRSWLVQAASSVYIFLPSKAQLPHLSSWPRTAILCFLLTPVVLVALWFFSLNLITSTSPLSSLSRPPHASLVFWPERGSADYSVRYTAVPLRTSSVHDDHAPQSPPEHLPAESLPFFLDPSSLTRKSASGLRLPKSLESLFFEPKKFDIVWTWVNGSDPLHQTALARAEKENLRQAKRSSARALVERRSNSVVDPSRRDLFEPTAAELTDAIRARRSSSPKLYRDHDELRYSVRSVLQYFGAHVGNLHVLSADFEDPRPERRRDSGHRGGETNVTSDELPEEVPRGLMRLGQIPQWLRDDVDVTRRDEDEGRLSLRFHHHSQFFANYEHPTFDSLAIESQMARVEDISEHFVYLNDDYFFFDTLKPSDFFTPAYGIVLRFQPDLLVNSANPAMDEAQGEWRPLHYSNWLLDERYGGRLRPYMQHAPKSLSLSILRELSIFKDFKHSHPDGKPEHETMTGVFRNALLTTGHHTFRGQYTNVKGHDDAYVMFLFAHHVVERWREMLLWSWVIGRLGGPDNEWTAEHRAQAWTELGGKSEDLSDSSKGAKVEATSSTRETLDRETVVNVLDGDSSTTYAFSSLDGYPYAYLGKSVVWSWPQFTANSHQLHGQANPFRPVPQPCEIELDTCFPATASNASTIFTNVAFANPACGDCIIRSLVIASGERGLEAFLPDASRIVEFPAASPEADLRDPLLPVEHSWQSIDFSLRHVLPPWAKPTEGRRGGDGAVNVREWVMRAMARYRFVLGDTPFEFVMLKSSGAVANQLNRVSTKSPRPALLCINDDLGGSRTNSMSTAAASRAMGDWMQRIWTTKAWWER